MMKRSNDDVVPLSTSVSLLWKNVTVNIGKETNKRGLSDVSGCARASRVLALMGPSGSGKTTLITVLSGRPLNEQLTLNTNEIRIELNGQRVEDRRVLLEKCGYVEQTADFGALIQSISVREHLVFQAMLRMPPATSHVERYVIIRLLLKRLNLLDAEHTLISRLSGGEGKRLSLASCLLTDPPVLLFDDCNTGLDSHLALSLIRHIRSLNKTAILVLHQPSTRMMALIDDLCLLGPNGRTVYMGPQDQALPVFVAQCPPDVNPADFFVAQAALARPTNPVVATIPCEHILQEQLALIKSAEDDRPLVYKSRGSYNAGFFQQVRWLLWRSISLRDTKRLASLLAQSLFTALIYGLLDLGLQWHQSDQKTVQNMSGLVIRCIIMITRVCSLLVIATAPIDHALLEREAHQQRLYSIKAYYLAKCIAEAPTFILMTWFFMTIVAMLTGLRHYFAICGIMILTTLCGTALGSLVSSTIRSKEARLIYWQPISQLFSTFSGFFLNSRSFPYVISWFKYLSAYYYGFSLSLIVEWSDIDHIACSATYRNASVTRCYSDGAAVLHSYNIRARDASFYVYMSIGLTLFLHLLSYVILIFKIERKK